MENVSEAFKYIYISSFSSVLRVIDRSFSPQKNNTKSYPREEPRSRSIHLRYDWLDIDKDDIERQRD